MTARLTSIAILKNINKPALSLLREIQKEQLGLKLYYIQCWLHFFSYFGFNIIRSVNIYDIQKLVQTFGIIMDVHNTKLLVSYLVTYSKYPSGFISVSNSDIDIELIL